MTQLQTKNPQMFNMINQARNNGENPQNILKQMMGNASPEQTQRVFNQARNIRCAREFFKSNSKYEIVNNIS